jgi:hypothetical protein
MEIKIVVNWLNRQLLNFKAIELWFDQQLSLATIKNTYLRRGQKVPRGALRNDIEKIRGYFYVGK